jgi:hypothetical protein
LQKSFCRNEKAPSGAFLDASDMADEDTALVHLRIPKGLKIQWVRASRKEGVKLTDWIISAVTDRLRASGGHAEDCAEGRKERDHG